MTASRPAKQAAKASEMELPRPLQYGKATGMQPTSPLGKRCGGSAANTMIALAQSGGCGTYAGKVAEDEDGRFYASDLRDSGIEYGLHAGAPTLGPTGTSIILTTPDAERTMCTHLGISTCLSREDVRETELKRCAFLYVEGYLWTGDQTRDAARCAIQMARKLGVKVAFTCSDSFLVAAFGDDFRKLIHESCDLVFCNADEARALLGLESLEACAQRFSETLPMAFITDGPRGAWVASQAGTVQVPGFEANAIDTVGAGDAFAGGVLYGLTHGHTAAESAKWGNYLASEVVKVKGPRLSSAPGKSPREILS
jgi:sugar/nucleoside kinase (ribokinase family)